jgi:phage terminase small subunit
MMPMIEDPLKLSDEAKQLMEEIQSRLEQAGDWVDAYQMPLLMLGTQYDQLQHAIDGLGERGVVLETCDGQLYISPWLQVAQDAAERFVMACGWFAIYLDPEYVGTLGRELFGNLYPIPREGE